MDMNENDNSSVKDFLEANMGPQRISHKVVLPITVLYGLIFISGVIGNAVVCMVISRNSRFQTPTNYYLFSLAISDLLILIFGLPNDLKVYWQQYPWVLGEAVCKLRALVAEMTSYASVLTIVAFTTERYIAIGHPLFIQRVSTLPRAIKFITLVWILACISAVPFAIFTKINYLEYPLGSGKILQQSAFCALTMENPDIIRPLVQFATFAFFVLPMSIIVILYVKISLKLRNSRFIRMASDRSSSRSSSIGDNRQTMVRKSVNKMLVAVVIAFFVCWAPFHAQRLLAVSVDQQAWTVQLRTLNEVLYYAAGCLYYFSATINPILYSLMSSKYRDAFRDAIFNFSGSQNRNSIHSPSRNTRRANNFSFYQSDRDLSVQDGDGDLKSTESNATLQVFQTPCNRKKSIYRTPPQHHARDNSHSSSSGDGKCPFARLQEGNLTNEFQKNGISATLTSESVPFTDRNERHGRRTPKMKEDRKLISEIWLPPKKSLSLPNANNYPKILITSYDSQEKLNSQQFLLLDTTCSTPCVTKSKLPTQIVMTDPDSIDTCETCV